MFFTNLKTERQVYEVTDKSPIYRELKPHRTQRRVKSGHLSGLIESYKNKGSALKDVPILVDRYGKIRDGHHRYLAAIALGIPYYVMQVSHMYENMIAINTNQWNWDDGDFSNYWAIMGRIPYKIYNKVKEEHPYISYGVLVSIFNKKSGRLQSDSKQFKEGNLTLDNLDHVYRTVRQLSQLKYLGKNPPLDKSTHSKQQFQSAMLEALQNVSFDFEKFKKNLTTKKHKLNILAKRTDMLKEIYKMEGK
jgi:hypothetical protein